MCSDCDRVTIWKCFCTVCLSEGWWPLNQQIFARIAFTFTPGWDQTTPMMRSAWSDHAILHAFTSGIKMAFPDTGCILIPANGAQGSRKSGHKVKLLPENHKWNKPVLQTANNKVSQQWKENGAELYKSIQSELKDSFKPKSFMILIGVQRL